MRNKTLVLAGLLGYTFLGCAKSNNILSSSNNSLKMHVQPAFSIFPDTLKNSYQINTQNKKSRVFDSAISQVMQKYSLNGLSATVISPDDGIWSKDTGSLPIFAENQRTTTPVFYWASVTKLITSTIIHQLIIEEKIGIDDTLYKWFPSIENSRLITIRELLNHTSGIYNFGSDSSFHFSNRYYSPNELIEITERHKNDFPPGSAWNYTNSGYLILALIAEAVEKISFSEIVSNRISKPYGLNTLKSLTANELPSNLITPATTDSNIQNSYATPLGAGNIVGSSKDLAIFVAKFMTGKYLPQSTIHGMLKNLYGMFDAGMYYGEGIMLYDFNEINQTNEMWVGHSGGIENYKAVAIYDVNTGMICAVSVSQNFSAEAIARLLVSVANK